MEIKNQAQEKIDELKSKLPKIQGNEARSYKITGRVYDATKNLPLKGANIDIIGAESVPTKSKKDGSFEVDIVLNYNLDTNTVLGVPILKTTYPNLSPALKPLVNQERQIRESLGVIGLINPEALAVQAVNELKNRANDYIIQASNLALSPFEKALVAQRKVVNKQTSKAQNLVFPLLLEVITIFNIQLPPQIAPFIGIPTSNNTIEEPTCPSQSNLQRAIDKRNRLTSQLNQIFITLATNASLAYIFQQLSLAFKQVKISVSSIPLPLGSPSGIGVPYAVVSKIQEIEDLLKNLDKEFDKSSKNLLISLIFLLAALIIILLILSLIDQSIEKCVSENEFKNLDLVEINQQLLDISQNQSLEGQPQEAFIQGFEISVIDTNSGVGDLRRRQAVAKDSRGIIIVRGKPSFSAADQILIEELKYYIQSNNLKAF